MKKSDFIPILDLCLTHQTNMYVHCTKYCNFRYRYELKDNSKYEELED